MNQLDALRLMVRNYPGGMAAVAGRLAKSVSALEKELGNAPGAKMGVLDACAISAMCIELNTPHSRAYVNAVAAECGGFVELPICEAPPRRPDAASGATEVVHECAQLLSAVIVSLSDKRISANELRAIEREGGDVISRVQEVIRDARALHQGDALVASPLRQEG